ncbi:MAG TPA: SET domain-containing protein [Acidimicrobiales bacterium]|nr:SET domain-containing protein [Acidimicrobiales bacterium]
MASAHEQATSALRIVRGPGKGRGVRAGRPFANGEVIDRAPVVVVSAREWELVEQTVLGHFAFRWDEDKGSVAIALSQGSLFNHSYEPNVASDKDVRGRRIVFSAVRDIAPGEELTINYNGDLQSREPVGFEVR